MDEGGRARDVGGGRKDDGRDNKTKDKRNY